MDGKSLSAQLLGNARRRAGLTQRQLATLADVPQPTISEIESARREPSFTLLSRILECAGFEIAVNLQPLEPFGVIGTARLIKERLVLSKVDSLISGSGEDGALRALLDLRSALIQADNEDVVALTQSPPSSTGDRSWDAFIAATVEDEFSRRGQTPPRWVNDAHRFAKPLRFLSTIPELHEWEFATTPAAFARHGVFVSQTELESV